MGKGIFSQFTTPKLFIGAQTIPLATQAKSVQAPHCSRYSIRWSVTVVQQSLASHAAVGGDSYLLERSQYESPTKRLRGSITRPCVTGKHLKLLNIFNRLCPTAKLQENSNNVSHALSIVTVYLPDSLFQRNKSEKHGQQ